MTNRADRERRTHDAYRLLAAGAVDGRIAPDDAAALEAHLETCSDCRADLKAMLEDHAWLANPGLAVQPDPSVRDVVLEAARAPRVPRIGSPARPWAALIAASLIVALIGGGALLGRLPNQPGAGATASPTAASPTSGSSQVAGACVPIPPDLTARWTFDDPVERFSGTPLTLVGDATSTRGIAGNALHLDASRTATVIDPHIAALGAEDFTISLWVRFIDLAGEQVLAERWAERTPDEGWTLTKLETGEIRLAIATDRVEFNGEFDVDSVGARLTPDTWHHIAARRLQRTFSLFVDGRQVATSVLPIGVTADLTPDLPLLFGRRGDDRGLRLDGDLDEVLVWTGRGLSDVEIGGLNRAGSAGFCEAAAGAGYAGSWQATDCAASGDAVNCDLWGDGSQLRVVIGPGEQPEVRFVDSAAAGCGPGGTAGPRDATGRGRFDGSHLVVTFTSVTCPNSSDSYQNPMDLYKAFNDPALWQDPDGDEWGIVWRPG